MAISSVSAVFGKLTARQNSDTLLYPAFSIAFKIRLFLTVTLMRYSLTGSSSYILTSKHLLQVVVQLTRLEHSHVFEDVVRCLRTHECHEAFGCGCLGSIGL